MLIIDGYRISNTNGSARQKSAVRVYHPRGYKLAEVFISQRNPLAYIRGIKRRSKHLDSLYEQCCVEGDMSEQTFGAIFRKPENEEEYY